MSMFLDTAKIATAGNGGDTWLFSPWKYVLTAVLGWWWRGVTLLQTKAYVPDGFRHNRHFKADSGEKEDQRNARNGAEDLVFVPGNYCTAQKQVKSLQTYCKVVKNGRGSRRAEVVVKYPFCNTTNPAPEISRMESQSRTSCDWIENLADAGLVGFPHLSASQHCQCVIASAKSVPTTYDDLKFGISMVHAVRWIFL